MKIYKYINESNKNKKKYINQTPIGYNTFYGMGKKYFYVSIMSNLFIAFFINFLV